MRVDARAQLRDEALGFGRHRATVEQADGPVSALQLTAEEDVGGDVEVGAQGEVLVDRLDAAAAGIERALEATGSPRRRISPPDGGYTPERIFEGRFAPVVTDEADGLGLVDVEVDAVERDQRAEGLGDPRQLEERSHRPWSRRPGSRSLRYPAAGG